MTANYLPWLVLLAIVIASLFMKGYIKLPGAGPGLHTSAPKTTDGSPVAVNNQPTLEGWDSHSLGIAFAKAKRLEAELEVAHTIATQAGEQIKAAFTAPFSPPAPAGPATPPASAPQ